MTRANRIREMSNKELDEFLQSVTEDVFEYVPVYPHEEQEWIDWLREECGD